MITVLRDVWLIESRAFSGHLERAFRFLRTSIRRMQQGRRILFATRRSRPGQVAAVRSAVRMVMLGVGVRMARCRHATAPKAGAA